MDAVSLGSADTVGGEADTGVRRRPDAAAEVAVRRLEQRFGGRPSAGAVRCIRAAGHWLAQAAHARLHGDLGMACAAILLAREEVSHAQRRIDALEAGRAFPGDSEASAAWSEAPSGETRRVRRQGALG